MKNSLTLACVALALLAASVVSSRAYTTAASETSIANGSGFDSNFALTQVSNTDFLQTATVTSDKAPDSTYGTLAGLNDGGHIDNGTTNINRSTYFGYNSSANGGTPKANLLVENQLGGGGVTITFALNLSGANALGYSVDKVTTITGWQDHPSVANQNYTLLYSTVSNPTSFLTAATVAYNPSNPTDDPVAGSPGGEGAIVTLNQLGLNNVADLRFVFTADPRSLGYGQSGTGLWLEEIDAVPEPGTWAMMGLGAAALLFVLRARRLNA